MMLNTMAMHLMWGEEGPDNRDETDEFAHYDGVDDFVHEAKEHGDACDSDHGGHTEHCDYDDLSDKFAPSAM